MKRGDHILQQLQVEMSAVKADGYGNQSWTHSRSLPYFDPHFDLMSHSKGFQPMPEMCGFGPIFPTQIWIKKWTRIQQITILLLNSGEKSFMYLELKKNYLFI